MRMAKKTISKSGGKAGGAGRDTRSKKTGMSVAKLSARNERGSPSSDAGMGEAFIKLMQSPLVAELVAVAATAALAALAEHGFTSGGTTRGKRAGRAVKEAGKAAAAAVGRRLGTEVDEIRKAASASRTGAKA
jgi:hypothetical protein